MFAIRASKPRVYRPSRSFQIVTAISVAVLPALATAAPWTAKPGAEMDDGGRTAQKVELVDVDGDGFVDVVFANSKGEGASGGVANREINQLMMNDQGAAFTELAGVFDEADNAWTIKAGDVDNDGDADLVVGDNFNGSTSYVLLNEGNRTFTREDIPFSADLSIGELELGDVDGDGDLDILAADWGDAAIHGFIDDPGGPLKLWLGNGDGTFTDGSAKLAMGVEVLAAWSFDLELVDINNDYLLDVLVSTRGDADAAVVLLGTGDGDFVLHPVPALQPMNVKNINAAFTPMDFDGDGFMDFISLQDGGLAECMGMPPICARRNTFYLNDKNEQFTIPGNYWIAQHNPGKSDFDAATLDFNSDGKPDFVTTGLQLGPNDKNSRLFLNDGMQFTPAPVPMDAAFPIHDSLAHTVGLMFADFDHDRREDVAVAQRDPDLQNVVLFGRNDPNDGIAEDTAPPRIYDDNFQAKLPNLLHFGEEASFMARVNDYKTPVHWHDFLFDTELDNLNLVGAGAALTAHGRRLPYMEFAFGLANPDEIKTIADTDPKKYIAPSIWMGEGLWRVTFNVPYAGKVPDTLTWQYCAIDAANNKTCVGPFQVMVDAPDSCGNGMKEEWEECDGPPNCSADCKNTCGNGTCDESETPETCPEDCEPTCDNDGVCEPEQGENPMNCPNDCPPPMCDDDGMCEPNQGENANNCDDCSQYCGDMVCEPGEVCEVDCCDGVCDPTGGEMCPNDCICDNDGVCDPGENEQNCPLDCGNTTETTSTTGTSECPDTAGAGPDGQCQLDDDGCGCVSDPDDTRGLWASLLLLGVFGIRRARKRA